MSDLKMLSFSEHQQSFAAYIRDPETEPLPTGLEARRMKIYSELFYNNVEGFISSGFPILRKITGDDHWHAMVKDFFINHSCQSPYFLEISNEFLSYLQNERLPQSGDPEFLLELAHYEWVELAMDTSEDEIPERGFNPEGDLMAASPFLSPLVVALQYRYDVHNIGEFYQPGEAPGEATYLLVYRNREHVVKFMEINAVTARLLALMQERNLSSGFELVNQMADELTHIDKDVVFKGGQQALEHLKRVGVVLGTRLQTVDSN